MSDIKKHIYNSHSNDRLEVFYQLNDTKIVHSSNSYAVKISHYQKDKKIREITIYLKNGIVFREKGPAVIDSSLEKTRLFYFEAFDLDYSIPMDEAAVKNIQLNLQVKDSSKDGISFHHFFNNTEHRDFGPSFISYNNQGKTIAFAYLKKGIYHRDDGPALLDCDENGNVLVEKWYQNGKKHRSDGPAVSYFPDSPSSINEWHLEGIKI